MEKLNFDTNRFLKIFFEVDDVSVFPEQVFSLGLGQSATGGVYSFNGVMRSPSIDNVDQIFTPISFTSSERHVLNFGVSGDFSGSDQAVFQVQMCCGAFGIVEEVFMKNSWKIVI